MKKLFSAVFAVLCTLFFILGCDSRAKLYVYNWTEYIPDEVIEKFEQRYGVRVVYDMYSSNEEMYAKLRVGGARYDLVFPSGDFTSIMIAEGMVKPLDKERVATVFANLDPAILEMAHHDPGFRYSVPYAVGIAGVVINTQKIPEYEESWRLFEDPELRGRITLLDDMREVMGAALRTLGYSVNSVDTAELEEAKELVLEWRRNIVKFDAETFGKGYAAGEFWAVHGYAENVFKELEDNPMLEHTKFFVPKEGGPIYMDNMLILKDTRNVDLAYKFINFIHEPEIYAKIMDYLEMPSINIPARKHMTEAPLYELDDILANSEFMRDLGEHLELYNRIWQEIRVGR
ncbi:MAG: extracellular solute-binding protein [Chitinispirillales bacterium]|nr:extracellular solute-binding protein [Chitinispirillales bacterium]